MSFDDDRDSLSDKLRELADRPSKGIRQLRREFSFFDRNATEGLYTYLAMGVETYNLVRRSAKLKDMIIANLKPRSKKPSKKQLLLLVFRYLLSAPSKGIIYDRARVYAIALRGEIEKGTDPSEIPQAIRDGGGIQKLYDRQVERERLAKATASPDPAAEGDENGGDVDPPRNNSDEDHDESGSGSALNPVVSGRASAPQPAKRKSPQIPFNSNIYLAVRCETETQLADVLGSQIESGLFYVDFTYKDDGTVDLILRDWKKN